MRGALAVAILALLTACAAEPKIAPTLVPKASATVWPAKPETPRYAYAGTLTGENDFRPSRNEVRKGPGERFIEFLAGVLLGDPAPVELRRPVSGYTDEQGRVFVADGGQQAVMVFDPVAKEFRRWPYAADDADFLAPVAIAPDGEGGIYVSDSALGALVHVAADGRPLGMIGADALERPTGLARDPRSGRLYVTDTARHRIVVLAPDGELIDVIGGRGKEAGKFNFPTHLAIAGNELYVADTLNFRIQIFNLTGDGRLSFGRVGLHVGDMARPKGVAVGRDGRIYVVESYFDHLLVFDHDGRLLLPIGGTGLGEGEFFLPSGVWTDHAGLVYVADMFNGRIAVFKELTEGTDG